MISEKTRIRKAKIPEKIPIQVLPKIRAASAPAIVAPRVWASVLRIRIAEIASSSRSCLIASKTPAPLFPESRSSARFAGRAENSAASSSEQRKEIPSAMLT